MILPRKITEEEGGGTEKRDQVKMPCGHKKRKGPRPVVTGKQGKTAERKRGGREG